MPIAFTPWIGAIAQLGERLHGMQEVSGSIPLGSTNFQFTRYKRSAWAALSVLAWLGHDRRGRLIPGTFGQQGQSSPPPPCRSRWAWDASCAIEYGRPTPEMPYRSLRSSTSLVMASTWITG